MSIKLWLLVGGLLAGPIALMAGATETVVIAKQLPKTTLIKATAISCTNAEQMLAVISRALASCVKKKVTDETIDTVLAFLEYVQNNVSTSKGDDTIISFKPYFTTTNLEQLYLLLDAMRSYFDKAWNFGKLYDSSAIVSKVALFKKSIDLHKPVNTEMFKKPSLVEKGIFKKNMLKLRWDRAFTFFTLTKATNARDVLAAVAGLVGDFSGSYSRTYGNFEGFYANRTDNDVYQFLAENTKGISDQLQVFLDKLADNVSIDQKHSSWWRITPYFDRGDLEILHRMLIVLQHFCIKKICIPRDIIDAKFNLFFARYGLPPTVFVEEGAVVQGIPLEYNAKPVVGTVVK